MIWTNYRPCWWDHPADEKSNFKITIHDKHANEQGISDFGEDDQRWILVNLNDSIMFCIWKSMFTQVCINHRRHDLNFWPNPIVYNLNRECQADQSNNIKIFGINPKLDVCQDELKFVGGGQREIRYWWHIMYSKQQPHYNFNR